MYKFDPKLHVHTYNGVALTGTSSIGDVLAKPLTWWASGMAVGRLGWIHPDIKKNGRTVSKVPLEQRTKAVASVLEQIKASTPEEYVKLLDEAYKAHSVKLKDTAKAGTDLHAELERFVKNQMNGVEDIYNEQINPFVDWAGENVKNFLWSEAHCFDEELFVGGITDCGAEMKDGQYAIIDFKSSKEAYPTQFTQCAGYAIQVEKNGLWDSEGKHNKKIDGVIGLLIVVPFGAEVVEPVARVDVQNCKDAFRSMVSLYRFLGLTKQN